MCRFWFPPSLPPMSHADNGLADFVEANALQPSTRIYFGWRVVLALFLSTLALFGISIYSFILLSRPMGLEFGWSATQTGMLVSAMYAIAPLALFAGPVMARIPPWRLVIAGLCIQAIAMILLGHMTNLSQFYALRVFMGFGKVMTASAAPLIVARWFSKRFATAVALVWAGGSAGGFVLAPVTECLVAAYDWRTASLVLAGIVFAIILVIILLVRGADSPATFNLDLDGTPLSQLVMAPNEESSAEASGKKTSRIQPGVALLMMLAVLAAGMTSLAGQAQQPTFLRLSGLSPETAAAILGMTAAGALIGSASIGIVLDRCRGWVSSLTVSGAIYFGILALYVVMGNANWMLAILGGMSMGYGFGAGEVLWITFTRRHFGERAFPLLYGGWYFSLQIGYALGGGVGGWGLEHLGAAGFLVLLGIIYAVPTIASFALPVAWRRVET